MGGESDTVRVRFVVEGGQSIAEVLREQESGLERLSQKYQGLRSVLELTKSTLREFGGSGTESGNLLVRKLTEVENEAARVQVEIRGIKSEISSLNQLGSRVGFDSKGIRPFASAPQLEGNSLVAERIRELKQYESELELAKNKLDILLSAGSKFPASNIGGQSTLAGPFNVGGDRKYQFEGDQASRSLQSRFDAAARSVNGVDSAVKRTAGSMQGLSGVTLLGTTALREFGVEGARGIEVAARSIILLREQGRSLQEVLSNKLLGFTALAIAGIALVQTFKNMTDEIRIVKERMLELEEIRSRVSLVGFTGGGDKLDSDVKRLEQAGRDIQIFRELHQDRRAEDVLRESLGNGKSREELEKARSDLAKAQTEADRRPLKDAIPFIRLIGTSQKDRDDALAEAKKKFAEAQGADVNDAQLTTRLQQVRRQFGEYQLSLQSKGQKNIFDDTFESLRHLANETGRTKDLKEFIHGIEGDTKLGAIGFNDITLAAKKFKEQLEGIHEGQQASVKLERALKEEFEKVNKNLQERDQYTKALGDLQKQAVSDNPLEKLFQVAINRQEQFREKFSDLGPQMLERLKTASDQVLALDLFKGDLTERIGFHKLLTEIQKIDSGEFGNKRDTDEKERERLVEGRIRDARRSGDRDALYAAQAASGTGGKSREFEELARQARLRNEFTKEAEFENQRQSQLRLDRETKFGESATGSELILLRAALDRASSKPEQQFVLDQIIQVTSNLATLATDQRDFRLRALQQRLNLGESERQRVLIEIRNKAGDSVTATIDEDLGPRPTPSGPASGSGSFGYGSSPRYGGDFDPSQGGF